MIIYLFIYLFVCKQTQSP